MPQLIRNALTSRTEWLLRLLDTTRNVDRECGHPFEVTTDDCVKAFKRGDVARRIISIFPDECWFPPPLIYETEDRKGTEFEDAWDLLDKKMQIISLLHRADVLSGVGRFGVVLLGLDDGLPLSSPVVGLNEMGEAAGAPKKGTRLLYARPFYEGLVSVTAFETDITNPRYGLPKTYSIQFSDSAATGAQGTQTVHWSRVVHLSDNRTVSEVYGEPRLQVVYNRYLDLKKVAGGSGEMFWRGGFPGLSLETQPGLDENVEVDITATKQQMESYMNGLQRYMALVGMSAKSLSVQVADPWPHAQLQLRLIAAAMAVPWRIFIGSEEAQLASSQDAKSWNRRVSMRQENYLTPSVLRPLVDRLIAVGVLPVPKEQTYLVSWPNLNLPTEEVQASVAEKRTNAITRYTQAGGDALIPPYHYLTLVLGFSEDETKAILKDAERRVLESEAGEGESDEEMT